MHNIAPPNSFVRLTGYLFFAFLVAASPMRLAVSAVTITGSPPKTATVGHAWSFTPTVAGAAGKPLNFWIQNRPGWAGFNAATGLLNGTPKAADVGTDANIIINVTNGTGWVPLHAFSIVVSQAGAPPPTISGTPATSVVAGHAYAFKPTATAAAGKTLQFSMANKPAWASFSASTGALAGTPAAASVGTYAGIVISASDGTTKVALPAFAITVTQVGEKSATLSWDAPTKNMDGSALTNLAGYRIFYGTSRNSLTQSITISSVGMTMYVISNLSPGTTYYFAIMAYNTAGVQSNLSTIVSKSV
jgi:Fibronectin type III domain